MRGFWIRSLAISCLAAPSFELSVQIQSVSAQDAAAPNYRTKTLDPAVCNDAKAKEKSEKFKPETFDIAAIEAYYQNCIFVRLAQPSAESMNRARNEVVADIEVM
jgi:hypothetical protein